MKINNSNSTSAPMFKTPEKNKDYNGIVLNNIYETARYYPTESNKANGSYYENNITKIEKSKAVKFKKEKENENEKENKSNHYENDKEILIAQKPYKDNLKLHKNSSSNCCIDFQKSCLIF